MTDPDNLARHLDAVAQPAAAEAVRRTPAELVAAGAAAIEEHDEEHSLDSDHAAAIVLAGAGLIPQAARDKVLDR